MEIDLKEREEFIRRETPDDEKGVICCLLYTSEALAISLVLLLTIPLSIGFFFVRPYEEAAWATYYRDITAAPVSYTHLDVYKRQLCNSANGNAHCLVKGRGLWYSYFK